MDVIQLIQRDHRNIEHLFTRFERAGDDARERTRLAREITRELSIHAGIEEQFVYPALRRAGLDGDVLAALEEHHAAKTTLAEIEGLPVEQERFAPKMHVLATSVRTHIQEEERNLLPALERALAERELRELGGVIEAARRAAPTRPHPGAPDTPPANFVANAFASVVDRARDALRGGIDVLRVIVERAFEAGVGGGRDLFRRGEERARSTALEGRGRALAEELGERLDAGRRALQASARSNPDGRASNGKRTRRRGGSRKTKQAGRDHSRKKGATAPRRASQAEHSTMQ